MEITHETHQTHFSLVGIKKPGMTGGGMSITSKELAELKKLAEIADEYAKDDWIAYTEENFGQMGNKNCIVMDQGDSSCGNVCETDRGMEIASYIAAARPQVMLAIITRIERLEKEADWLAEQLSNFPYKSWREAARMAVEQATE